jgi:hypothetical protein
MSTVLLLPRMIVLRSNCPFFEAASAGLQQRLLHFLVKAFLIDRFRLSPGTGFKFFLTQVMMSALVPAKLFVTVECRLFCCYLEWLCWGPTVHFLRQPRLASNKGFYIFSSKPFSLTGFGSRGVPRIPNIQEMAKQNSSNIFLGSLDIRWDRGERYSCSWSVLDQISPTICFSYKQQMFTIFLLKTPWPCIVIYWTDN